MKIAILLGVFPAISETFILNQITGLIQRGHDVDIYARVPREEGKLHSDINEYDLLEKVSYIREPRNIFQRLVEIPGYLVKSRFNRELIKSLNVLKHREALTGQLFYAGLGFLDKKYDVVHCHYGPNGNLAANLKKIGIIKSKIITTFHGYDLRMALDKGSHIYRDLKEIGDRFIAISEWTKDKLLRLGFTPEKIKVLPNGINLDLYKRAKLELRYQPNPIKIVTIARLSEEKGIDLAIKAVAQLKYEYDRQIQYHIIGDGQLKPSLIDLAGKHNLNVIFHGFKTQEEIARGLKNYHIYLLPSRAEVLPTVLMEAQATGLPIVASDVGAVNEMVTNQEGFQGFACHPSASSFACSINSIISIWKHWKDFGTNNRKFAYQNYDSEKINEALIKIYEEA